MPPKIQFLGGTRCTVQSALVVNLFGGPGAGKTTFAARLFAELKMRSVEAACPEEHAKIALWQGREYLLDNQMILLGRGWDTVVSLSDKVEVIILDSPILFMSHYAGPSEPQCFHDTVADYHRRTDRLNLVVQRDTTLPYSTSGRRETAEQASLVDAQLKQVLTVNHEPYTPIPSTQNMIQSLADQIQDIVSAKKTLHRPV